MVSWNIKGATKSSYARWLVVFKNIFFKGIIYQQLAYKSYLVCKAPKTHLGKKEWGRFKAHLLNL